MQHCGALRSATNSRRPREMNADRQRENNAALFNSDAQRALASAERVHLSPTAVLLATLVHPHVASRRNPSPIPISFAESRSFTRASAECGDPSNGSQTGSVCDFFLGGSQGRREGGGQGECAHEGISANVDELQTPRCTAPPFTALRCWSSEHGRILSHMRHNIALPDRRPDGRACSRVLIPDPPDQRR